MTRGGKSFMKSIMRNGPRTDSCGYQSYLHSVILLYTGILSSGEIPGFQFLTKKL